MPTSSVSLAVPAPAIPHSFLTSFCACAIRCIEAADDPLLKPPPFLLLGSGALQIGQAGEFDYSGDPSNQGPAGGRGLHSPGEPEYRHDPDSEGLADKVYFAAITPDNIDRILEREQCHGILLGFGGQTALNCGLALAQNGACGGGPRQDHPMGDLRARGGCRRAQR